MLRRRSRAVAEHSQHMLGKAMDTTMPNMSMEKVREIGMKLQRGGVGYYGASNFVHLDVGSVRAWPRLSYDQLARLFPDGKTVHLAADGRTLARYDEARAEIEATGGIAQDRPSGGRGFFAFLFGGGRDEEDDAATEAAPPRRGWMGNRTQVGAAPSRGAPAQIAAAENDDGGRNLFVAQAYREARRPVQEAERNLPRGETYMSPTPAASPTNPKVAALEPKSGSDRGESRTRGDAHAALPLPPRRPGELTTASIPLPPLRPVQARRDDFGTRPARRGLCRRHLARRRRRDPQPDRGHTNRARAARHRIADRDHQRGIQTRGGAEPSHGARLCAGRRCHDRTTCRRARATIPVESSRRPRGVRRRAARPVEFPRAHRPKSVARMTTHSVLGPAAIAPRAASRAELDLLAAAPAAGYVTGFGRIASDLPTNSFTPRAVTLARAGIN